MDIEYLLLLQSLRNQVPDFVNQFFLGVSALAISLLPVLIAVLIFWCVDKKAGYFIALSYLAGMFVNQTIKTLRACIVLGFLILVWFL